MPLNLSVGDADFTPYLKYNAKAGRFYIKPEGAAEEVEIANPLLAFDMANIKTGWLYYAEGQGPEKVWDPSPSQAAPRPTGPQKWKRGFEVMVIGNAMVEGKKIGLREFSSTAGNVIGAIVRMHAEYEAGLRDNPDKVPVYLCDKVKPITGAYGVNYEPQFTLKAWVERSRVAEFDKHAPRASTHAGNGHDVARDDFGIPQRDPPIRRAPAADPRDDMDQEIPF